MTFAHAYYVRHEEKYWGRVYVREESDGTYTLTWDNTSAGQQPAVGKTYKDMRELVDIGTFYPAYPTSIQLPQGI